MGNRLLWGVVSGKRRVAEGEDSGESAGGVATEANARGITFRHTPREFSHGGGEKECGEREPD
jgi:hypothetical protein